MRQFQFEKNFQAHFEVTSFIFQKIWKVIGLLATICKKHVELLKLVQQ